MKNKIIYLILLLSIFTSCTKVANEKQSPEIDIIKTEQSSPIASNTDVSDNATDTKCFKGI